MKRNRLALLFLIPLIASCGNNSSTGNTSSTEDSAGEVKVSSVKEAIQLLQNGKSHYSLVTSDKLENYSYFDERNPDREYIFAPEYYTKNANLGKDEIYDTGYLLENGGVSSYTFNNNDETLLRSELITDDEGNKITSLDDVAPRFENVTLSGLEETEDGIDFAKKKKSALALFELFEIDTSNYFYLESFTVSFLGPKEMNDLFFLATFNSNIDSGNEASYYYYAGAIQDYGKAESYYLEDFLADPTPAFVPTEEEIRIRKLFSKKNYTQYRDDDGDDTYDQFDYFTDQYYYVDFTDEYKEKDPATVASYGNKGYMALNNAVMNYQGTALVFIGCYLFYNIDDAIQIITREDPNNPGYAQSSFQQVYTDISYVMNYPNRMICLSEFQGSTVDDVGVIHFKEDEAVLDFINNFNLADTVNAYQSAPYYYEVSEVRITPLVLAEKDEDCEVRLELIMTSGTGNEYMLQYDFKDFGSTKVDAVEDYIDENGLRIV